LRAITRVRYGTPGQGLISSNVSYTPRGSIATSAAPYYWPSDPAYNQTTAYDDLDRPISITEADGAVTTISYGLSSEPTGFHMVTTTDPTGRVTVVHSDARGNVIRKD